MFKPFLTIHQQIEFLKKKGIQCESELEKSYLYRLGYFNLVNGYRDPFISQIDPNTKAKVYLPCTSISVIKYIYDFDESLRLLLFPCLIKVENEIRVITAYKFDEINYSKGCTWSDTQSYHPHVNPSALVLFINKAKEEIMHDQKDSYVNHYLTYYESIPTWIFTKTIKLNTFINFLRAGKTELLDDLCTLYGIIDEAGRPWHKLLINMLYSIKLFRNLCAHNERIYSNCKSRSRIKKETYMSMMPKSYQRDRDQHILDLLLYLKYFMNHEDFCNLIDAIMNLLNNLRSKVLPLVFDSIRSKMGIKHVDDLRLLKKRPNIKNYNRFERK